MDKTEVNSLPNPLWTAFNIIGKVVWLGGKKKLETVNGNWKWNALPTKWMLMKNEESYCHQRCLFFPLFRRE